VPSLGGRDNVRGRRDDDDDDGRSRNVITGLRKTSLRGELAGWLAGASRFHARKYNRSELRSRSSGGRFAPRPARDDGFATAAAADVVPPKWRTPQLFSVRAGPARYLTESMWRARDERVDPIRSFSTRIPKPR